MAYCAKGWHCNIFCTPIFVLGQDESQGSNIEIADGQKASLLLSGQGSTLYFNKPQSELFVVHRMRKL